MKTAKTLVVAALVGLTLAAITAPASARGSHGHHGPRVSVGIHAGPVWWGPGWGHGWRSGPGWGTRWAWGPSWGPGWGSGWGPGIWGPSWVVASPPPVVVMQSEPRVFIERDAPQAAAPAAAPPTQWWYWCVSAKSYYPYVSTCSEGWQRVPPQPVRQ